MIVILGCNLMTSSEQRVGILYRADNALSACWADGAHGESPDSAVSLAGFLPKPRIIAHATQVLTGL